MRANFCFRYTCRGSGVKCIGVGVVLVGQENHRTILMSKLRDWPSSQRTHARTRERDPESRNARRNLSSHPSLWGKGGFACQVLGARTSQVLHRTSSPPAISKGGSFWKYTTLPHQVVHRDKTPAFNPPQLQRRYFLQASAICRHVPSPRRLIYSESGRIRR